MPSIPALLLHLPTPLAYIILNIDPVLLRIGSLAIHWYGLMYVVAISIALYVVLRWARHMGLHDDQVWNLFVWAAIGGLVGGRLYFVIQQPDLVKDYLLNPINIIAVWNGGMAFFGAIFLGSAALFIMAPRYGLDRWLILDGGALFAAVGQIFGRFGNIINGDILGYQAGPPVTPPQGLCLTAPCVTYVSDPHVLSWAFVYLNPASFAPQGIPFQPAPVYEMGLNLVALAILWPLRLVLPRVKTGVFFAIYLALYSISQFIVFFFRGSEPITPFLGIAALKQAQWTAIFTLILAGAIFYLARRYGVAWPFTARNPEPYPLPEGGLAKALATAATPVTALDPGRAVRAARMKAAPAVPPEDLPPWTPGDSRFGSLRNLFATARWGERGPEGPAHGADEGTRP
ncbi:MAG TPA: prolipoprotein diacylglyceryl transferase [Ktedonobacterales bacterium]|nr:prolipoprotein diacylglyceryl transferase [Ktedonobacterales bacterium]